MKTFRGLSLQPADAFKNIAAMIEVGMLIAVVDSNDDGDLSDCVFSIAQQYAAVAHEAMLEYQK